MPKFPVLKFMILEYISKYGSTTGYSFMKYCSENGIPASSGTVYPHLKDLTNKEIIHYEKSGKKKIYYLTEKGEKITKNLYNNKKVIENELKRIGIIFNHDMHDEIPKEFKKEFFNINIKLHNLKWDDKNDISELINYFEKTLNILRRKRDEL